MKKFFLTFFLLAVGSWAACSWRSVNVAAEYWGFDSNNKTCSESYNNILGYVTCTSCTIQGQYASASCPGPIGSGCASYRCAVMCTSCLACDTQAESDSAFCALYPMHEDCYTPCDSTQWTCTTTTEHSQTTIASDNIECFGGDCFGGVYCEYLATTTTECRNDCGQITQQTTSVPIRYEGNCNQDNLTDVDECTGVKCTTFGDFYSLYKLCKSREIVNGEHKFLPHFVGGGKGSCQNSGYPETDSTNFSSSSTEVPESCFLAGIGCPVNPDTTNYNVPDNRTPDKCSCEPFDGFKGVSRIVCPDGSITLFYGTCDDFRSSSSSSPVSSSSDAPPESSSSENGSSGGVSSPADWTTYSQGEDIKQALGIIASKLDKEQNINNVNNINIALDNFTASPSDSAEPFVVPDSMLDVISIIDTSGIVFGVFGRITEENEILDTLPSYVQTCPVCTFFSGGSQIGNGLVTIPQITIDFSNLFGLDLCAIVSRIVTALASVVSFFIGFAIFKNISQ